MISSIAQKLAGFMVGPLVCGDAEEYSSDFRKIPSDKTHDAALFTSLESIPAWHKVVRIQVYLEEPCTLLKSGAIANVTFIASAEN